MRLLGHPDGWWRDEAQRELVHRGLSRGQSRVKRTAAQNALIELSPERASGLQLVHAMWASEAFRYPQVPNMHAFYGLHHDDPRVVAQAIRVSEPDTLNAGREWSWDAYKHYATVEEPIIRRQLALSLGESPHPEALSLLAELVRAHPCDAFLRSLAVSSVGGREEELARLILEDGVPTDRPDLQELLAMLAECAAKRAAAAPGAADAAARLEDQPAAYRESVARGEKTYGVLCSACHLADGTGLEGLAPPVAQSDWLERSDAELAQVILQGLVGPIEVNGKPYDLVMPPLAVLTDQEIADVLTYVRWHHDPREEIAPAVDPQTVAAARAADAGTGDGH